MRIFPPLLVFIFSLLILPAFPQHRGFVSVYSIEEGFPQSQVRTIQQDKDGYLWFGSEGGGLTRYDGVRFTSFTTDEGFSSNLIYTSAIDLQGNLWIGTNKGVNLFRENRVQSLPSSLKPLSEHIVRYILVSRNGDVALCTGSGAYFYNGKELSEIPEMKDLNVLGAYEDKSGKLWFGTQGKGIFIKEGNSPLKNVTMIQGISSNTVYCFFEGNEGKFYIGTEHGVTVLEKEKFSSFPLPAPPLSRQIIRFFSYDREGSFWVGTYDCGIYKFSKDNQVIVYGKNDVGVDGASAFLEDTEGNIWLGTDGNGAVKIGRQYFTSFTLPGVKQDNIILSLLQDSKGRNWFGNQAGLVLYENNSFTFFNSKNGFRDEKVWSVCEDKDGNVWASTYGSGIFRYTGNGFVNYGEKDGLSSNNVRKIYKDSKGNIWIGTASGLNRLKEENTSSPRKKFEIYTIENCGLPSDRVLSLFEDSKHNLWVGTSPGISVFSLASDPVMTKSYSANDGLSGMGILGIVEDQQGNIWTASFTGLNRIEPSTGKIISITKKDGLVSNTIYAIEMTRDNFLMVGTNSGVDKLDVSEYNRSQKVSIRHYGIEEGFLGGECNTSSIMKDEEGKIWIGSLKGTYIYNPSRDRKNETEPRIHISGVRLFFKDFDMEPYASGMHSASRLPPNITLPYDKNHLTFDFVGLSYSIPSYVKYKYKIEGYDRDWSIPVNENFATYANLPSGKYIFKVLASNNDGIWNRDPAEFSFTILPPFWKTWWFRAFCGIAGILLIAGFIQVRLRRLKQIQEMLSEQVKIKTKELREEKETVEHQKKVIEKKNQNITSSIHYARRIQESILPVKSKIKDLLPRSFVLYKPKDIVSGDFYWFTKHGETILLAAVDCTGHGVPGAFISLVGNNLLNDIVNGKKITDPKTVLEKLHEGVVRLLKKDELESGTVDGMDITLCAIGAGGKQLEFASTGRPLMLLREGKLIKHKIGRQPVGLVTDREPVFEKMKLELKPGDTFYVSTDGYCDQFGGKDEDKFMEKNFEKLLLTIQDKEMAEQKNILWNTIEVWRGNIPQVDDILVIGVKVG